jgi:excisionase family DNA binding protein
MNEDWLSLAKAAQLLGVHPSTVRLWSDKGILPVHRTQGGHRRFKQSEIKLWAESSLKSGAVEAEGMLNEVIRNVRMHISEGRLEAELWYRKLDDEARQQYRQSARSLFQGLMSYLGTGSGEAASEAYAIGYEYASRARRYELSYVEAARAFLFFRDTLIESVIKVYSEARIPASRMAEMFHKITFTDDILISLLETLRNSQFVNR